MHRSISGRFGVSISFAALLATTVSIPDARAIDGAPDHTHPANYDIRLDHDVAARATLARFRDAAGRTQQAGDAYLGRVEMEQLALRGALPSVRIDWSQDLGAPEVVGIDTAQPGFLGASVGDDRVTSLRGFIADHADLFGLQPAQVAALETLADYRNPEDTMAFVTLAQRIHGLPVFRGEIKAAFSADGNLVRTIGNLAPDLDENALGRDAGDPRSVIVAAAASIGENVHADAITVGVTHVAGRDVELIVDAFDAPVRSSALYFPTEPGVARLAWRFLFWQADTAWYVIVDAAGGDLLWRKQIAEHQSEPVTYGVYGGNSPAEFAPVQQPQSPNGAQAPMASRSQFVLIGNEAPNTFNNLGWITDGVNQTAGNNVISGLDRVAPNDIDPSGVPSGSSYRSFQPNYNPAPGNPAPGQSPTTPNYPPSMSIYQVGSVVNAFYWSNRFHDRAYRLGFTELARNFQNSNFGRGGQANDRVRAEIQDYDGVNNAYFATPIDGLAPRMMMYLWTNPEPSRDGSLDRQILVHELTHGLSNRLIGNSDGLSGAQPRGLGEGWSDFYALTLFASASSGTGNVYPLAAYSVLDYGSTGTDNYYYGLRRYPYALMATTGGPLGRPHNPLTFADIDPDQILINDGAYPRDPADTGSPSSATAVHKMGEVWALSLFEGRARLVARLGFAEGNDRMLQIVTNGMKLTPLEPDFIDARNAVLAAAQAMGGSDVLDLWHGFATRGLGIDASTDGIHVEESFNIPGITAQPSPSVLDAICNASGAADPGEAVDLLVPLRNSLTTTVTGINLSVNGAAPVSYGSISANSSKWRTLPARVPNLTCGGVWPLDLDIESNIGTTTSRHFVRLGKPVYGIDQDFDAVVGTFPPTGWTRTLLNSNAIWQRVSNSYSSSPYAAHVLALDSTDSGSLTTPAIAISNTTAAELSFRHRYDTEVGFDGGVLEISINGSDYFDIIVRGGRFVGGSYDGRLGDKCVVGGDNPLEGRYAWSGDSGGWGTTRVVLPQDAIGQSVRLRWRIGTDCSIGAGGWTIDDVRLRSSYQCLLPACNDLIFRDGFEATP
ncbi:MAG: M36 family metallopeptidase [Dokdonella sp.]